MTRLLFFLTLLGAAVGIPYGISQNPDIFSRIPLSWGAISQNGPSEGDGVAPADATSSAPPDSMGQVPLEGLPYYDLAEVFRMDITPDWIYSRWSRKSSVYSSDKLHGIRVPLVTGTQIDDVAGSLTYYYDAKGVLRRIAFRGRTGDSRKLVGLVETRFGLRRQKASAPGEHLYQRRWNGRPLSQLSIRPADVLWAAAPHASFEIEMELMNSS